MEFHYFELNIPATEEENHEEGHGNEESNFKDGDIEENDNRDFDFNESLSSGDEEEPHRVCKNKNFVDKVMFLAAVVRSRFDSEGNVKFSGKIGIYSFITKEPAKRNSINRAAGTMETKAMTSDNTRTHVDPKDPEFYEAARKDGFDICLMCQPAKSPDLNVLDLGFFNAIQSLRYKVAPKTIDELVGAVEEAYEAFSPKLSNKIFLTLQSCMLEIMKTQGSNRYKIPHMNKGRLEKDDNLPRQLTCDVKLIEETHILLA
ncbi:uncharacterized protein LOC141719139 [Apium graveolens]|uniref:uncharacterized protein LOC141719139 n=1 Tax=Apium graveolens TaxID=4045 RepID=UPI003D7A2B1E